MGTPSVSVLRCVCGCMRTDPACLPVCVCYSKALGWTLAAACMPSPPPLFKNPREMCGCRGPPPLTCLRVLSW